MLNIQRIGWHTLAGREHPTNDVPLALGAGIFMGPCSAATVLARTPLCREPVRETADEGIARIEFRLRHELVGLVAIEPGPFARVELLHNGRDSMPWSLEPVGLDRRIVARRRNLHYSEPRVIPDLSDLSGAGVSYCNPPERRGA
jgi:hypothetical protein